MTNKYAIIENKWDEIKENVQEKWDKLTDMDMNKINGSYNELVSSLQKSYGYTTQEIEKELNTFLKSIDFDEIKDKAKSKLQEIKSVIWPTLKPYVKTAKKKSLDAEKLILNYAQKNPIKLVSIAAATGLIVGYACKSKKVNH